MSLLSVDAALAEYAAKLPRLGAERVPVAGAVGRVLSADGVAATDLPPFDQSAMDGYAVLAADLAGAAPHRSVALEVGLEVAARAWAEHPTLLQGRCARIFTGAIVPEGADAVVAQEDVTRAQDLAEFAAPVARGHHVRPRGSELREGAVVARAGQRITPGLVGALAAAGSAHVDVVRRPRVALIVTGDEVVAPGQPLALGQVYDCNAPMAAAWLAGRGADVRLLSSRDTLEGTAAMVAGALDDADLVVTTGGVSVGEKDLVIAAAHRCGVEDHFWRVAQKPGKPLYFGSRGGVGVIGLPGNPAAVFVGLVAHVDAALRALEGRAEATRWRSGRLANSVRRGAGRDEWVRCAVDYADAGVALRPLTGQASHMLSNLGECDGLALVRSGDGVVEAGAVMPWLPVAATG
ncbi:MAG: molybdopterin molybdotransferase MoeA [Myxococcales bacterium]|nr:molybdopterin molybdotransferase MoeA [Myxococcales bacterium]